MHNRVQKFCEEATIAENSSDHRQQDFHLLRPSCKSHTTEFLTTRPRYAIYYHYSNGGGYDPWHLETPSSMLQLKVVFFHL